MYQVRSESEGTSHYETFEEALKGFDSMRGAWKISWGGQRWCQHAKGDKFTYGVADKENFLHPDFKEAKDGDIFWFTRTYNYKFLTTISKDTDKMTKEECAQFYPITRVLSDKQFRSG